MTNIIEFDQNHKIDRRRQARSLYWQGWPVCEIASELSLPTSTISSWKAREKWDDTPQIRQMESCINTRYAALIAKSKKTGGDMKEIDLLGRQIANMARIRNYEKTGKSDDLREEPRKKPVRKKKNHFTVEQAEKLRQIFEDQLFDYQRLWWENRNQRNRIILKSRQIGATYYFAFEALIDAIETGRNQIFLSASRAQALQFRSYIVGFAKLVGVDLSGDPLMISSELTDNQPDAELHFIGTNFRTAQGRHGNFYFDEFFWTHGFEELFKVASGMAMQKKYRKTYLSTPSTILHPAYEFWTGDRRNRRLKKSEQLDIDVSYETLKRGFLGADGIWRNITTIHDAVAGGCDLFDINELLNEYSPDQFANLLECQFVDDSLSAFKFNDLQRCFVDAAVDWEDVELIKARPYGEHPVWAGYDPQNSEDGDNAALVVIAPPKKAGDKFRILERYQLKGLDFQQQAEYIIATLSRYNCTYLGIERSAIGDAVCQCLGNRIKCLSRIEYSIETKQRMVMKAQNVIRLGRLEMDAGCIDIVSSFISIKKTITNSGHSVTFKSDRAKDTGHADLAWSVMHVLINEPLDGDPKSNMIQVDFV